jgi:hypothetical protein
VYQQQERLERYFEPGLPQAAEDVVDAFAVRVEPGHEEATAVKGAKLGCLCT